MILVITFFNLNNLKHTLFGPLMRDNLCKGRFGYSLNRTYLIFMQLIDDLLDGVFVINKVLLYVRLLIPIQLSLIGYHV
jgi:hypothetical protein